MMSYYSFNSSSRWSQRLHDIVASAASQHSTRVAVTFDPGSGGSVSLLYSDAVALWNQLTQLLRMHCFQNNGVIGLYCHADLYLPVCIVGILQVPAAYVPIDPDAPGLLSARIMARCGLKYCVLQSDLLEQFQTAFSKLVTMDVCAVSNHNVTLIRLQLLPVPVPHLDGAEQKGIKKMQDADLTESVTMSKDTVQGDLAYVLHTSGTTGLPKTVRMSAEDVVFLASPLTFDPSVVEMFLALSSGARLLIVPNVIKRMPNRLAQVLFKNHSTTVLQVTPSLLGRFGRGLLNKVVLSASSSLRVLALGGETCPSPTVLRSWRQEGNRTHIYNIYGITEVSCWACCYRVPESVLQSADLMESSMPLGTPLMGTTVEVRDEHGCIVTQGEGQVFIGGEDRVCLLDDEQTVVPGTMRGTGDWVQVRDTQLYYLGRRDRLIKRHGQRVHLDTVQQVVMSLPQVESCAVGLHEGSRLVVFVVASTSGDQKAAPVFPSVKQHVHHSPSVSAEHQRDAASSVLHHAERDTSDRGLQTAVLHHEERDTSDRGLQTAVLHHEERDTSDRGLQRAVLHHEERDTSDRGLQRAVLHHAERDTSDRGLQRAVLHHEERDTSDRGLQRAVLHHAERDTSDRGLQRAVLHHEERDTSNRGLQRAVLHQLSLVLPSYSVPDAVVLVPVLPLSSHGKVDMAALMKMYQKRRDDSESRTPPWDEASLRERLQSLWRDTLGLAEDTAVEEGSNFLFSGGDSLKALRLCDEITTAVGMTSPGLLEIILDGSFLDVLRHVATATLMFPSDNSRVSLPEARKRRAVPLSTLLAKRENTEPLSTTAAKKLHRVEVSSENRTVRVIRRAGQVVEMKIRDSGTKTNSKDKDSSERTDKNHSSTEGTNKQGAAAGNPPLVETSAVGLSLSWSSDTGRCVDASPVLLVQRTADPKSAFTKTSVFIGSHSHRIQALDLATGGHLWERVLGDRVESSAAVTQCGTLVVVGCYDGCVYFLCVESGETRWVFETGDAVKSSPAVDPLTGLVIVGSHDGHIYALDPQVHQCVWRRHCGGGAVFSSPYLHPFLRQLYVASLGGHLLCLNPDSGAVLWTYSRETPFFSSPNGSSGYVVIGSVDGNVCCFSCTGELLWQYLTKGPIFSSPCVTPDQQSVLCGSHDGCVYRLNCTDGSLVWSFQTSGKVYSSPFGFDGSTLGRRGILVAVASTDGTVWILDGEDGTLAASLTLPGELFSSPVVWKHSLVVGCRNDFVYCVELAVKRETLKNS